MLQQLRPVLVIDLLEGCHFVGLTIQKGLLLENWVPSFYLKYCSYSVILQSKISWSEELRFWILCTMLISNQENKNILLLPITNWSVKVLVFNCSRLYCIVATLYCIASKYLYWSTTTFARAPHPGTGPTTETNKLNARELLYEDPTSDTKCNVRFRNTIIYFRSITIEIENEN